MNHSILYNIKQLLKTIFPKWQANRLYKNNFGRSINWNHPTEFNEKIRYLQFYSDTSKWPLLADKYRVRKYITEKGYEDILVKLYGVWKDAKDIDFSKLPNSFVLKTNHGCGSVYIIKNKQEANLEKIKRQLNKDLKESFGIDTAEPHYLKINPVIIAEELLRQDGNQSSTLIDYKFYCIYGEPQFCGVMYNRNIANRTYDVKLYDNDWKDITKFLAKTAHVGNKDIPRPRNFDAMKEFCRKVCAEFPFVRMDFYESNGKLYFGEFTFTPAACSGGSIGPDALKILADQIHNN